MDVNAQGLPLFGSLILKNCFYNSKEEEQFTAIQLVFVRALEAFKALADRDLPQFDALVGDQACQIRALKIITLCTENFNPEITAISRKYQELLTIVQAKNSEYSRFETAIRGLANGLKSCDPLDRPRLQEEFNKNKKDLEKAKKAVNAKFITDRKIFIEDIKNNDILVSQNTIFLLRSYFLNITKSTKDEYDYPTIIDHLKFELGTLKSRNILISSLFKDMQYDLSRQSVDFVRESAAQVCYCEMDCLLEVIDGNKVTLPFFHMTKIIFLSASEREIPIFLKIKNIREKAFARGILFSDKQNMTTGLIIEAFSSSSTEEIMSDAFKEKMYSKGENILNMINYNAAQHDGMPEILSCEAIEKGFSKANPEIFCITHIFADLISNQMKEIS